MTHDSLIAFFSFASIVVAGGLGIAGTLTETKDKKGRLTKWGMVALAGIVVSNSFSFVQTYLEREQQQEERIASEKAEKQKALETNARYKDQIDRLTLIVNKSDTSLQQQLKIQDKTGEVLTEVNKSVDVQNRIVKQSKVLTTQQEKVAANIDRTLNPLLPFKVSIGLTVQADSNSLWIGVLTKLLNEKIDEVSKTVGGKNDMNRMEQSEIDYLAKGGVFPMPTKNRAFLIKKEYQHYNTLMNSFSKLDISMLFDKNGDRGKEIKCDVLKEYLQNKNNFPDLQLIYFPQTASYYFTFEDLPVRVNSDLQAGPYSIQDLENSSFSLTIANSPGLIRESTVTFKFPPDFSRINTVQRTGNASNVLSSYNYYTYSYKTDVRFFH